MSLFSRTRSRFALALLLMAVLGFGAWGVYAGYLWERVPPEAGRRIDVVVVPGQNARDVAAEFERLGIVARSRDLVRWLGRLGADRRIKPGFYAITAGRASEVAREFSGAEPEVLRAMILPGALLGDIASLLRRGDAEALLLSALGKPLNFPEGLRPLLGGDPRGRTVFLAPETYSIDPGDACADRLVSAASSLWWTLHRGDIPDGTTSADLTDAGILASVVQKEALVDSDRPIIAGVFKNRLRLDMALQSCATVVHAWRLRGVKITTVSYNDVRIDSPFNTYARKGLPPENIGVPSGSSWTSVLRPAETEMLFFVARADGSHVFTRTYEEHLAAQKKIRKGDL
jgi:UPF0755 protein